MLYPIDIAYRALLVDALELVNKVCWQLEDLNRKYPSAALQEAIAQLRPAQVRASECPEHGHERAQESSLLAGESPAPGV